jgi:protein-S-isoprenylcysteine O-methyltransferase Ste14
LRLKRRAHTQALQDGSQQSQLLVQVAVLVGAMLLQLPQMVCLLQSWQQILLLLLPVVMWRQSWQQQMCCCCVQSAVPPPDAAAAVVGMPEARHLEHHKCHQ